MLVSIGSFSFADLIPKRVKGSRPAASQSACLSLFFDQQGHYPFGFNLCSDLPFQLINAKG